MTEAEMTQRIHILYEEIRQMLPHSRGLSGLSVQDARSVAHAALLASTAGLFTETTGLNESDVIKREEECQMQVSVLKIGNVSSFLPFQHREKAK